MMKECYSKHPLFIGNPEKKCKECRGEEQCFLDTKAKLLPSSSSSSSASSRSA
jgi:hypothetical protein